ncbi:MAG: hypothetical protein AAB527_00315 [Patescibacteria group bacterium]
MSTESHHQKPHHHHEYKSRKVLFLGEPETPRVILFLLKNFKFIKNQKQAAQVVIGMIYALFLGAAFLILLRLFSQG